ncbi:MAG: hypothetical protein WAQ24_02840 [Candidatus Saccharimonadales bacterium]
MLSRRPFYRVPDFSVGQETAYLDLEVALASETLARAIAQNFDMADQLPPAQRFRSYAGTTLLASLVEKPSAYTGETEQITPWGLLYFEESKIAGTGKIAPLRRVYVKAMAVSLNADRSVRYGLGNRMPASEEICYVLASTILQFRSVFGNRRHAESEIICRAVLEQTQRQAVQTPRQFWLDMGANEPIVDKNGQIIQRRGWLPAADLASKILEKKKEVPKLALSPPIRTVGRWNQV